MSKHTPGPWRSERSKGGLKAKISGENWNYFAKVWIATNGEVCADGEANARLIVAAPDLLAACESAVEFIRNGIELGYIRMPDKDTPDRAHEMLPTLESVVAKARGQ